MKTTPLLLTLAMGAAAQKAEVAPEGNIRATKLASENAKRDLIAPTADIAAPTAATEETPGRVSKPSKNNAARERRSQQRTISDSLHRTLFNKDFSIKRADTKMAEEGSPKVDEEVGRELKRNNKNNKKNGTKRANRKNKKIEKKAATATLTQEKGKKEDRELKKTKSGKPYGGGWGGGGMYGGRFGDDDGLGGRFRDHFGDDDHFGDWSGGYGGRFDNDVIGHDMWGGGKSGKAGGYGGSSDWWGGGKADKGGDYDWAGGGKSGKAGGDYGGYFGKAGGSGSGDYGASCEDGYAWVTVTNLSFRQSFSEIFAMTSTYDVTRRKPIFRFGLRSTEALAELAQNADASEMIHRYSGLPGVEMTKVFTDFGLVTEEKWLRGGGITRFRVDTGGNGDRLTLAMGLPFTNDGAVVLDSARIYDGAEYFLRAIDVGVEGNIQTCWSVPAEQEDFPFRSECADTDLSDRNDNNIPGEQFVSMHRGIQDFDSQNELRDLLEYPTCEDLDLDGGGRNNNDNNDNDRFAQYFFEVGFDDELLLCEPQATPFAFNGGDCDYRDDGDFLDFIRDSNVYTDDDRYIRLANESDDFDDFCDNIDDANKDIDDAFRILESHLFDWRNDIAHVQINCGWYGEDWEDDGHHDDDWVGGYYH